MYLFISTVKNNVPSSGEFYWGSSYFQNVRCHLPNSVTDILQIQNAILFFLKKDQSENFALYLKINSIVVNSYSLKVKYSIVKTINLKSYLIKYALKEILQKRSIMELPFCCAVNEKIFYDTIDKLGLFYVINSLEEKNNWKEIYDHFLKYQPIEKSFHWNNADMLSKFSFAFSKLAQCSVNLKKKFPDPKQRASFLKEKKEFRELTVMLRERCIELQPENPSFHSNIGYSYYQSVSELAMPGCRRDGNISAETKTAIKYLDQALKLDSTRIADHYRKARLLFNTLALSAQFKQNDDSSADDKKQNALEFTSAAIQSLAAIVKMFEENADASKSSNLPAQPGEAPDDGMKRYKKYYIKALYNLSQIHYKLGKQKVNPKLFSVYPENNAEGSMDINRKHLEHLSSADQFIDTCILKDNYKKNLTELIDKAAVNNDALGVHKLYLKGLVQLAFFIHTKKAKHNLLAKEFLYRANETEFPKEMQRQNKIFILEKIALLNIAEKKYDNAIAVLEPIQQRSKFFPEYAQYTLALAYTLNNQPAQARQIISKQSNNTANPMCKKFLRLEEFIGFNLKPQVTGQTTKEQQPQISSR